MGLPPGGARFTFKGSALSHNGAYILAPSGASLRLFSAVTGGQVGVLEGHQADICCVATNAREVNQVYTASLDGTIRVWDYVNLECVRTLHVRETVVDMVFHPELPIVYLSVHRDGASGRVVAYDLEKEKAGRTAMKTSVARPLTCSGQSSGAGDTAGKFVATFDRHSLLVWRVGEDVYQPLNLKHTKPFTCVAISADESMIAAGDSTGRILIWRGFASHVPTTKQESQGHTRHHTDELHPTTLHWHASPVGCLTFSSDTSYLLSGGREAVLVLWRLDGGGQTYLPRLGGPLAAIRPSTADPARYLVCQGDNTLRVVNTASMTIEASVLGVKPAPAALAAAPGAAAAATLLQPGTGHLVVPCENGELQIYDTLNERHVSLIKVVNRNYVAPAPERFAAAAAAAAGQPLSQDLASAIASSAHGALPYVSHAAFAGPGGAVLVTVDVRASPGGGGAAGVGSEACLRFWDAANATTRAGLDVAFTLNTRVDEAHSGGVAALAATGPAAGDEVLVVTTGGEAEFKVWERVAVAKRPGGKASEPSSWRCRALGGYKGLPLTAAAFSHDGSALAVAAGHKVTLWEPHTCRLVTALSLPSPGADASGGGGVARRVAFVSGSPFVVAATDRSVAVWNLLTGALHWALDLPVSFLAADPAHALFAVAVPLMVPAPVAQTGAETAPAGSGAGTQKDGAPTGSGAGAQKGGAPAAAVSVAGSVVLLFDPQHPSPRYHCPCPGTVAPALLFSEPGMPQAAGVGSEDGGRPVSSPLLMVSESRALQYLSPPVASTSGSQKSLSQQKQHGLSDGQGQEVGAFEAAFGALQVPTSVGQGVDGMDVDVDPTKPRWRQLFDAPSHALPPPTALAEAFLRLINA